MKNRPMEGIKVLEIANWVAAPSCAMMLSDMGAEVFKIEPPEGDALRGILESPPIPGAPGNLTFYLDNRGKKSIIIDFTKPNAFKAVHKIISQVDIVITNLTDERAKKYHLSFDDAKQIKPDIVYSVISGYGTTGPDAFRRGFDFTSFWAHSGIQGLLGEPGDPPPPNRGSQGDHISAMNLLAATLAALRLRDISGEAQRAEVTLQRTGMWTIAGDVQRTIFSKEQPKKHDRQEPKNPIFNSYQTKDGKWVMFAMAQTDRYWPRFCDMVQKPQWKDIYTNIEQLMEHTRLLTSEITGLFLEKQYDEWAILLDDFDMTWAPVVEIPDLIESPQLDAIDAFAEIDDPEFGTYKTINVPFSILNSDIKPRGPAPMPGQDTNEVLKEFGFTSQELSDFAANGLFG